MTRVAVYGSHTGMPAKTAFSDDQIEVLIGVLRKHQKRFKNQTEMALALGITQPSLSSMLAGKWKPGLTTAKHIAALDQATLEDLLPDFRSVQSVRPGPGGGSELVNLEKCLSWHDDEDRWATWTVAAARAGVFGTGDFAKAEWVVKLDALEKALARVRKAG